MSANVDWGSSQSSSGSIATTSSDSSSLTTIPLEAGFVVQFFPADANSLKVHAINAMEYI
eukprot:4465396-Pyramimonas_sp.AAC.1